MIGLRITLPAGCRNFLILSTLGCASPLFAFQDPSISNVNVARPEQQGARPSDSATQASLSPEAMGDVLLARRRYVEAIELYHQEPNQSSVLWNKLGIAHQHLLNDREARRDYERALNLNPRNGEATNNLGTVLYSQKDYSGAIRQYKRALRMNPKSAIVYINLGTAYFAQEKYKKGAEAYRSALALDPMAFDHDTSAAIQQGAPSHQRAELSYFLAKTYAEAGNLDQALKYLRRALSQGFTDRKKIMSDKELASLRETPEFRQLLTEEHLN